MCRKGVYEKVPTQQCIEATGKLPTSVRRVDTNTGNENAPNVRSRLVARDFKVKDGKEDDLYASMPPLEAKKIVFALVAR